MRPVGAPDRGNLIGSISYWVTGGFWGVAPPAGAVSTPARHVIIAVTTAATVSAGSDRQAARRTGTLYEGRNVLAWEASSLTDNSATFQVPPVAAISEVARRPPM